MMRRFLVLVVAGAMGLTGCAEMERYHFPQTQDKVPVKVILAFSDKYPNNEIKSISEEKMFDGSVRYAFTVSDAKTSTGTRTVGFTANGEAVESWAY